MKTLLALFVALSACSARVEPAPAEDAAADTADSTAIDTSVGEVAPEVAPEVAVDANPAAACASTFGSALTDSFGKLDGVVTAVVRPVDTMCPMPNSTHVVVQVKSLGAIYRLVVNVQSDRGTDLDVRFATITHPGISPWLEGWHAPAGLDYATFLDVHSGSTFTPTKMDALIEQLTAAIPIGAEVSIYATSSGGSSAHLIHRNGSDTDGAIVVAPRSPSPKWLLFHFSDQSF